MKNSLTRKLLLAVITLGIAVIATVGSTYAWFSMNTTVEATGMQLTAVTPVNVVISKDENTGFAKEVEFTSSVTELYPASTDKSLLTSSGTFTFFAVREGQVIGSNGEGGQATTGSEGTLFQPGFSTTSVNDKDYVISETVYLKTTTGKVSLTLKSIDLGTTTITNSGATIGSEAESGEKIADAIYIALCNKNGVFIYQASGQSGNHKGVKAVASDGTWTEGDTNALSVTGTTETLIFNSAVSGQELGTDAEAVTVLVWLEGEDPQCVNAIGGLGLSIGLEFGYVEETFIAE